MRGKDGAVAEDTSQCSWCSQDLGYHESLYNADSVNYHCSTLSHCCWKTSTSYRRFTMDALQDGGFSSGEKRMCSSNYSRYGNVFQSKHHGGLRSALCIGNSH